MSTRPEVQRMVELGPFPSQDDATEEGVTLAQERLEAISPPVSMEEARLLINLFGPDTYGLAWSLMHLVESAPAFVIEAEPAPDANNWLRRMWDRQKEPEALRERAREPAR